jgi:hypothetical protein
MLVPEMQSLGRIGAALAHGTKVDIHEGMEDDDLVMAIYRNAEVCMLSGLS